MIKNYSLRFTLLLIATDIVLVVLALLFATYARIYLPFGLPGIPSQRVLRPEVYFIAIVVHLITYSLLNVHNPRNMNTLLKELQVMTAAAILSWMVLLGALYLSFRQVSRLQIGYFLAAHMMLIYVSRIGLRLYFVAKGQPHISERRVLVIGTADTAQQMIELVEHYRWTGLVTLGMLALSDNDVDTNQERVIGTIADLETIVHTQRVSEVIIAIERDVRINLPELVHRLEALPVNIRIVPQYVDLAFLQVHVEDFSGMPLLTLKEPALTPYQRFLKRAFDICITLLILLPALPIMGLIAILIKLDSPGPVIFRQVRIGEGGNPFEMYKFRSMINGAEWLQEQVMIRDEDGNLIHKRPNDPRVTRVGALLRISSLDELPQLFNILRGDMSLVGPRPEMPNLVDRYAPWQRKRFEVPQGLTGWWQINGRANKPMHLSTEDDLFYIRNYSLWLDIRILWRTFWTVISRRGAY